VARRFEDEWDQSADPPADYCCTVCAIPIENRWVVQCRGRRMTGPDHTHTLVHLTCLDCYAQLPVPKPCPLCRTTA
jgi:hypothetical protein